MTPKGNHHYFKLLSGILAKLALLTELVLVAGNCDRAQAQIIPDRSLGTEASVVTPNVEIKGLPADRIDGGAIRDSNLFHSFQEFNIGDLQRVFFANPEGITNIFSRVTGSNLSEIFGTLGVNGNANLFFINPNGIIFGENASLDVGGSFAASTANAIQFGDRGFFSATEPEQPPLLTVKPSAFFFNQINPGKLENRSIAPAGVDLLVRSLSGLEVPDGKSLLLVGGDIALDGGELNALGGRVELAGVKDSGTIGLNVDGNNLSLSFSEEVALADVLIKNGEVDVRTATNGGSILINAQSLNILDSTLWAGIRSGLGTVNSQAGDITIKAESISVDGVSGILNSVRPNAMGNGGDITIQAGSLSMTGGGEVIANTRGIGNVGDITVQVQDDIVFDGVDDLGFESGIFNVVRTTGQGDAGKILIEAGSLSLTNGGRVIANTTGQGDSANVTIQVRDRFSLDGIDRVEGEPSGVFTTVRSEGAGQELIQGVGDGGDILVKAGSLSLTNGGQLTATTFGIGDAGNITIEVRDRLSLDGVGSNGESSGIFSAVAPEAVGNGGDIKITADSLSATNGATLSNITTGKGNAGNVTIDARETVVFDGVDIDDSPSEAISFVRMGAEGKGGDINITTGILTVQNGARLDSSTAGEGEAGNISVTANTLKVINGGRLLTTTSGNFNAGNIILEVQDNITLAGANSGLFANTTEVSKGNGGSIFIDPRTNPRTIAISDGAQIAVDSQGSGEGGEISLIADSLTLDNQASISAETASNTGGDITLTLQDLLLLRRGSNISATAGIDPGIDQGAGDGGNIKIETPLLVTFPQENSDIRANAFEGKGGNINIDAQNILGFQLQEDPNLSDIDASSELGLDGIVNINTSEIEPGRELIKLPTEIVDVR